MDEELEMKVRACLEEGYERLFEFNRAFLRCVDYDEVIQRVHARKIEEQFYFFVGYDVDFFGEVIKKTKVEHIVDLALDLYSGKEVV